jgi:hypothetical protein
MHADILWKKAEIERSGNPFFGIIVYREKSRWPKWKDDNHFTFNMAEGNIPLLKRYAV